MDISYIMESGQNELYTNFPNIFLLISAESADLSHNQKIVFLNQKCAVEERERVQ